MSSSPSVGRSIFAALCASLVGIGLARFAYTPLIPPLIESHWFAANDVLYLGAANLVGYLAGAVGGRPLAARLSARRTLRWMMALASLAFFACAVPVSVSWFFFWRFMSGLSGGIIMVLAAITVLPHIPLEKRGMASGAIFLGLGLGIAGSGTVVPLLLHLGLWQTWAGLGAVSALLTAATWTAWPAPVDIPAAIPAAATAPAAQAATRHDVPLTRATPPATARRSAPAFARPARAGSPPHTAYAAGEAPPDATAASGVSAARAADAGPGASSGAVDAGQAWTYHTTAARADRGTSARGDAAGRVRAPGGDGAAAVRRDLTDVGLPAATGEATAAEHADASHAGGSGGGGAAVDAVGASAQAVVSRASGSGGDGAVEKSVAGGQEKAGGHAAADAEAKRAMAILYIQYALMAVGLVPMMIFLVDYVARGLGLGAQQGALFWIAYGIGAIVGPMMYGAMGDRITPLVTSRIAMLGQIAAIAVLVSTTSIPALILATLVIGTFPPGIVPIYLSQIQRLLPGNAERQSAAWSRATTIYALCQALVGYASSWLLAASGGQHRLLFILAAAGLVVSLAIELSARLLTARQAGLTMDATRQ